LIHTVIMLAFWAVALPFAALVCFPWTFLTGNISFLYRTGMWAAWTGVRLAGVKVRTVGMENIDPSRTYIFMSNHVSNIDPPILLPLIPRRTSVMAKKELFSYPLLGKTMKLGSLVPVDRGNRDAGIAAVREAAKVIRQGINMTIYVEGKRSFDGKLLPFKKGPFYLAIECGVPVVPVTMLGTQEIMPKARFGMTPGTATVVFHDPIEPKDFGTRDELMAKVRAMIESGLPVEARTCSAEAQGASR
jgi:1-acyl-sn-glycerol-3-phosphate acyltransferase